MSENHNIEKLDRIIEHTLAELCGEDCTPTQSDIVRVGVEMINLLLYKNGEYGNSALSPRRCASKLSANETINVYIDAKLQRIDNADYERMNDWVDLMGYINLKCVDKGWLDFTELLD
jgi:hypothetical protein